MSISLAHPIPSARISAHFGWRPAFTENGVYVPAMLHNGTDWAASAGTPIRAMHRGQVTFAGWDYAGGGNAIKLGTAKFSTMYLHMESPTTLKLGDMVQAGDVIGYVGSTGNSTGPHLHGMLQLGGQWVDPLPYINATPTPAPAATTLGDPEMPWILILMKNHHYLIQPKATGKAEAILLGAESLDPKQGASTAMLPRIAAHTAGFTQDDIKRSITGIRAHHLPLAK